LRCARGAKAARLRRGDEPAQRLRRAAGIETLGLRMDRHVANTRKVVEFLLSNPAVESVSYPELPSHPDYELAKRLLPKGCGAVFSFNLKGDRAAGRRFVDSLKVFSHLANVGDAKSLAIHPASTTHFRVPSDQLAAAGITRARCACRSGWKTPTT
jgi:O-acetylhomoserine (thiol)-lyase